MITKYLRDIPTSEWLGLVFYLTDAFRKQGRVIKMGRQHNRWSVFHEGDGGVCIHNEVSEDTLRKMRNDDYYTEIKPVKKVKKVGKNTTTADMRTKQVAAWRKRRPVHAGVMLYFPDALMEVAYCSFVGNEQHNPGEPLHWAKEKSTDETDALSRHLLNVGQHDTDGVRESAKVAWRALANLQRELDAAKTAGHYPDYVV